MSSQPPDIVRSAYADLVVTDLERSRSFWVDLLGFHVTAEEPGVLWLRGYAESTHHSLVLREGSAAACAAIAFRLRNEIDVDRAAAWYAGRDCRVEVLDAGARRGVGRLVRATDPLGFTVELFHEMDAAERLLMRWDLHRGAEISRIDHINIAVPDVQPAYELYRDLGFGLSETIEGGGHLYATWMYRKPTVHDIAMTEGTGPRLHHLGFTVPEATNVLRMADIVSARGEPWIERGPGRHGVSAAFYLYLRDPDGHRIEIYTTDYYTGDPGHETLRWSIDDPRRRDFWGGAVVPSWYSEATEMLDLDGKVVPVRAPVHIGEAVVGADGLS